MDQFDLVIFDCDGVLVDSELIAYTIFAEMLNEIGLSLTLEEIFDICVGKSLATCLEIIKDMFGKSVPDNFAIEFRQRTIQAFMIDLQPVQGIHDVLSQLKLSYCVASNSNYEWLQKALTKTSLLPYFLGKIFSATEVARSKPAPDVFLYAAEKMGFSPERCVVIEDTPTGVKAGVDAGMTVFGYAERMNPEKLREAGACIVFNDMRLLPELLKQPNHPEKAVLKSTVPLTN
jgi:HAD superfamily hydrolase (TIGR01509 family)